MFMYNIYVYVFDFGDRLLQRGGGGVFRLLLPLSLHYVPDGHGRLLVFAGSLMHLFVLISLPLSPFLFLFCSLSRARERAVSFLLSLSVPLSLALSFARPLARSCSLSVSLYGLTQSQIRTHTHTHNNACERSVTCVRLNHIEQVARTMLNRSFTCVVIIYIYIYIYIYI